MDTQRTLSSIYLKEECAWPLFPERLVGSWKVHLTIESVDNILQPNHSNQWNLFSQYFQILTLGIFQSEKVSTVEPLQSLSYDHLFCMLLRPYIFLTQTQKSLSHFIILKTTLMQPPRYNDQGFIPLTVVALMGFYHTRPFIRKILDWRFLIYLSLCPFKGGFHILYKRCFYD